jgi:hypothetical protein
MDKGILPPLKQFDRPTSRLSITEWNERLRAMIRDGAPEQEINDVVDRMHHLHVRMNDTTVGLLVRNIHYLNPNGVAGGNSAAEHAEALPALGAELYSLPKASLSQPWASSTTAIRTRIERVNLIKARFHRLQSMYTDISSSLAAYAESDPPYRPDYFAAPFPELDAFQAELRRHYDHWDALVPQYEAAVVEKVKLAKHYALDLASLERKLKQNPTDSALAEQVKEAAELMAEARQQQEMSEQHAQDAVAFRDNFKRDKIEDLPNFLEIEDYPTPSLSAFKGAYDQRKGTLPADNLPMWRGRLDRAKERLQKVARNERALIEASNTLEAEEQKIHEIRASTDISNLDYSTLNSAGKAEYARMRAAQKPRQEALERERALIAQMAGDLSAQQAHADRVLDRLMAIEHQTINELSIDAWSSAARRFAAAVHPAHGRSLEADSLVNFVATYQLYRAWVARHGSTRPGTEISIVTLEALANVVRLSPSYPPAVRIGNEMADRLITVQGGAGVRAVRENVKHLTVLTPADFEPLPPLTIRHVPIHRLLNALATIIGDAKPAAGVVKAETIGHMGAVSETLRAHLHGSEKGLFNLEDYAEHSQPKKVEGARMRVTVERLAKAYQSQLQQEPRL